MGDLTELRRKAAQQAGTGNYWAGKAVALIDQLTEVTTERDRLVETLADAALLMSRMVTDDGSRTELTQLVAELGFTQEELDASAPEDDRHAAIPQPGCNVCVCGALVDDPAAHLDTVEDE